MSGDLGRFTWYELLTSDPQGGIDFYTKLVGWGTMTWEGDMPYDMFTVGDNPIAGVMQLPEEAKAAGAPPHWLGYVYTPDLDGTTAKARELGGNVLNEIALPDIGRIAILADPQGGVIAVFQPANDPQPEHDAGIGEFSWHELMTTDYEAAFDFYSQLFGWELSKDMDMGEHGVYRLFGRNGKELGGMFNKPPEVPAPAWLYYANVESCHDAATATAELGGQVVNGPMEVPGGGFIVHGMDPQGAMFALYQIALAAAEAES